MSDEITATPWVFEGSAAELARAEGLTTLVEGQTFSLSTHAGDMVPGHAHGLFLFDTRVLSRWVVSIDGVPMEPLAVDVSAPFEATFASRLPPPAGRADSSVIMMRRRSIGNGLRDVLTVRNVGLHHGTHRVQLSCGVDFANLFAVKEGRAVAREAPTDQCTPTSITFRHDDPAGIFVTHVRFSEPADVAPGSAAWQFDLAPGESREVCIEVSATVNDVGPVVRFPCGEPDHEALPAARLTRWREGAPTVRSTSAAFDDALRQGIEDLGALRIFDPEHSERAVVAAGAPWFMALFGRDSLLTAWMSLLVEPDLAVGVVETLAAMQGRDVNSTTEEEPGRILHEARLGVASNLSLRGGAAYYGSADSTPLFVMLVGEMCRWGIDAAVIDRLMPHVDAALAWIADFGDRDDDGYVEYHRATPGGLANQGWKDSWDAIRFADARLADSPIALCEVQGYVYAAYRARADLAVARQDAAAAAEWSARAEALRTAFNRDFWLDDRGWYALGLDARKQPIDALASNMGHCLWSGIVDTEHAEAVADRLLSPAMFGGWGVRTLASSMPAYNPVSYHNGSVWPHDTAICAAGLMRYGFVHHAHRLIGGLVDASVHKNGRLPELFAGFGRDELGVPAPYPTSCSPQAWAAAAPLLLVRTLLRLDPVLPVGRIWMAPALPKAMHVLHVEGIAVSGRRISVHIEGDRVETEGTAGLDIVARPRPT